ncbi:MAG: Bax inhibitor-1/YccA family protein [Chlamydiia bacterium]|nr:Bax inhibitor-1/YccA family protein [Chlamydiia bacterium]
MRSANPTLQNDTFSHFRVAAGAERMSVQGVIGKAGLMLLLVLLTAGYTWTKFYQAGGNPQAVSGLMMGGMLVGFILAMVTAFKAQWSGVTAPAYALAEGLFLGGISALFEANYPGIALQAVCLTFGTMGGMLLLYQAGILQATDTFKRIIFVATAGIAVTYLLSLVLSFFDVTVPFIYGGGIGGILFSLFVVCIAALNFIIDFDFIERGAAQGAPKYMEWYGAFALMVTLIWLYIEFLRLLSKLRER